MQEPAWSGDSTPYFSFLGIMPLHYMAQHLMCLLLLWLVLKWSTFQVKRPPPRKNWAGYGPEYHITTISLGGWQGVVLTGNQSGPQDVGLCPVSYRVLQGGGRDISWWITVSCFPRCRARCLLMNYLVYMQGKMCDERHLNSSCLSGISDLRTHYSFS